MLNIPRYNRSPARRLGWLAGLAALAASLLASCSSGAAGGPRLAPDQTFIYPNTTIRTTLDVPHVFPDLDLDPAFMGDLYSENVLNMIQVQLYTFDSNLNIIPDAAVAMPQISPDGKTWTVHLRTGLRWSDGTPMTAQDFAAGMLHALDPNLCNLASPSTDPNPANRTSCAGGQPQAFFLSNIVGASAYAANTSGKALTIAGLQTPDPQTLVYHLINPATYFLDSLATMASAPLEQTIYAKYGANFPEHYIEGVAQSGPFVISAWRDPAHANVTDPQHCTELIFTPNPHWWGKPPILTKVVMPLEPDIQTEYRQYLQGTIDFSQVPPHEYPFTRDLTDFHQIQALAIDYLWMNWLDAPFNILQVRQAFDLALNKQLLVDTIFQGARIPTNHLIPLGIAGYNTNLHNPPDNSGTPALTGNQPLAQQDIQQVAAGCQARYDKAVCPFIIGTPANSQPITSLSPDRATCPTFNVGTQVVNGATETTQTPIDIYVSTHNPDITSFVQAAADQFNAVLCLNVQVVQNNTYINDVYGNLGHPTKEQIWSLGYAADYPDPQDFTTNIFDPAGYNDSANVGVAQGADLVQAMHNADAEQDPAKRDAAYAAIEQQLVDQVAVIPYDQPKMLYRVRQTVEGLTIPATEVIPDQSWTQIFIVAS